MSCWPVEDSADVLGPMRIEFGNRRSDIAAWVTRVALSEGRTGPLLVADRLLAYGNSIGLIACKR